MTGPRLLLSLLLAIGWAPGLFSTDTGSRYDGPSVESALASSQRVAAGQMPFVGLLFSKRADLPANGGRRRHYCSGTLVAGHALLTAAHCTHKADGSERLPAFVRVNITRASERANQRKVTGFYRHPKYDPRSRAYDVAILLLARPFKGVPLAELARSSMEMTGQRQLTVAGFGMTAKGRLSRSLKVATLEYVPSRTCEKYYQQRLQQYAPAAQHAICAGSLDGLGVCEGDGGSPLLTLGGVQVGVASFFSGGCGRSALISGFTDVREVKGWVKRTLKRMEK